MSQIAKNSCRFLICFAFEEEARIFRQRMPSASPWCIHLTGMGAASARQSMKILHSLRPEAVLTCGFAGALNPQLGLGDVVFQADAIMDLEAKFAAAGARAARFLQVDQVIWKSEDKLSLWRTAQADAVDMESQVIREICHAAGLPSATLRAISDTATDDLPLDFNYYLLPDGKPRWLRLGGAVLQNRSLIPRLIQLRRGFRLAASNLAQVRYSVLEA